MNQLNVSVTSRLQLDLNLFCLQTIVHMTEKIYDKTT